MKRVKIYHNYINGMIMKLYESIDNDTLVMRAKIVGAIELLRFQNFFTESDLEHYYTLIYHDFDKFVELDEE